MRTAPTVSPRRRARAPRWRIHSSKRSLDQLVNRFLKPLGKQHPGFLGTRPVRHQHAQREQVGAVVGVCMKIDDQQVEPRGVTDGLEAVQRARAQIEEDVGAVRTDQVGALRLALARIRGPHADRDQRQRCVVGHRAHAIPAVMRLPPTVTLIVLGRWVDGADRRLRR